MIGTASATIIGRVGRAPEVRHLPNGRAVARLRVAVGFRWKGKDGQRQERTDWFTVVVWGQLAELAGAHVTTGMRVLAHGRLQVDKNTKTSVEYVELIAEKLQWDFPSRAEDGTSAETTSVATYTQADADTQDEIPF